MKALASTASWPCSGITLSKEHASDGVMNHDVASLLRCCRFTRYIYLVFVPSPDTELLRGICCYSSTSPFQPHLGLN